MPDVSDSLHFFVFATGSLSLLGAQSKTSKSPGLREYQIFQRRNVSEFQQALCEMLSLGTVAINGNHVFC